MEVGEEGNSEEDGGWKPHLRILLSETPEVAPNKATAVEAFRHLNEDWSTTLLPLGKTALSFQRMADLPSDHTTCSI